MKINFEVPDDLWGRLASAADDRGVTVAELVSGAVKGLVVPARDMSVVLLVRAGWCDADIARQLMLTNAAVSSARRRAGLKANRRFK